MTGMREALAAAIDREELEENPAEEIAGGEPEAGSTGGEPEAGSTGGEPEPEPEGGAEAAPEGGSKRDALGRFAGKAEAAKPEQLEIPGLAPKSEAEAAAGAPVEDRAPVSWSPAAREEWKNIGPTARAEIRRRENEVDRTLSDSADARSIASQFAQIVTPHMARIRANGVNPIQAVDNLFATEASLSTGTKVQRAQTIAKLIAAYDVDLGTLDGLLAGEAPGPDNDVQQLIQQTLQRELAPMRQIVASAQQRQQAMSQQVSQQADTELQAFAADPKNEFYEDVRELMADIIEAGQRHGIDVSLPVAYAQAIQLTPGISQVLAARGARSQALGAAAAARRARMAAASISGAPVVAEDTTTAPDLRGAISQAIATHSRA